MKFYVYNKERLYIFETEATKELITSVGYIIEMSIFNKKSNKTEDTIKGQLLTHEMAVEMAKTDEILKSLMPDDVDRGGYDEFTVTGKGEIR